MEGGRFLPVVCLPRVSWETEVAQHRAVMAVWLLEGCLASRQVWCPAQERLTVWRLLVAAGGHAARLQPDFHGCAVALLAR